jgi:LDH2 family malate/lactate/ureidoglycolate dehydrogenase
MRSKRNSSRLNLLTLSCAEATRLGTGALVNHGVVSATAENMVAALIANDLEGYPSHGLLRIPDYVEDIRSGRLVAQAVPAISITPNAPICHIDARHAPAVTLIETIKRQLTSLVATFGIGAIGLRNAHHLGRLALLARPLIEAEPQMAVIGFGNFQGLGARQSPSVGKPPTLSTNPLLIALPLDDGEAFILDMSTTVVAEGRVRNARDRGVESEEGWLIDRAGKPVLEPHRLYEQTSDAASMTSLGYPYSSHKGFALALAAELIVGMLGKGHNIANPGTAGNSLFLLAIALPSAGNASALGREIITRALAGGTRWPGTVKLIKRANVQLPQSLVLKIELLAKQTPKG